MPTKKPQNQQAPKTKTPRRAAKARPVRKEPPRGPLDLPEDAQPSPPRDVAVVQMSPEAMTVHQAVLELEQQGYIAPVRKPYQPVDPPRAAIEDPTALLMELNRNLAYLDYFNHVEAMITCELELLERKVERERAALREQLRADLGSSMSKQRLRDLVRLAPRMQELDDQTVVVRRRQRLVRCMVRRLQLQMRVASRRVTVVALEAAHHGAAARLSNRGIGAIFS